MWPSQSWLRLCGYPSRYRVCRDEENLADTWTFLLDFILIFQAMYSSKNSFALSIQKISLSQISQMGREHFRSSIELCTVCPHSFLMLCLSCYI